MPALSLLGRSVALSPDDFWFVWVFIVLHPFWAAADSVREFRAVELFAQLPLDVLHLDITLSWLSLPLDVLLCITSAKGVIMEPRRYPKLFRCSLVLWILLAALHALVFTLVMSGALWHVVARSVSGRPVLPPEHTERPWALALLAASLVSRTLFYLWASSVGALVVIPQKLRGQLVDKSIRAALRLIGARAHLFDHMAEIFATNLGQVSVDKMTPTDFFYGLLLVAGRQQQGALGSDPFGPEMILEEELVRLAEEGTSQPHGRLPASVRRACQIFGVQRPVTPFNPSSEIDQAALREITHLMPFASGIYGPFLFGLPLRGFEPGSVYPKYCCCALCGVLPCWQQVRSESSCAEAARRRCCCCAPCFSGAATGPTEGDGPCGHKEDHLMRSVREAARKHGVEAPELLWATWTNDQPDMALPMAVFMDHAYQQVVITIRGTAELKDFISDVCLQLVFWDPLGTAGSKANKEAPFDEEEDFFVPECWLSIASDMLAVLDGKGVLDATMRQRPDCRIVVTGHSLGAGVGSLLALLLLQRYTQQVHFVGFATPGNVLSKQLSQATQRLGWLTTVCAHDWAPRMTVRNIQKIRDRVIEELERNDRSKFQLACQMASASIMNWPCPCLGRRWLAAPFRSIGGGVMRDTSKQRDLGLAPLEANIYPEMWPPGDIAYFKPLATQWLYGVFQKDTSWSAQWADPEDIEQEIILTSRAMELHAPWVYDHAIQCVVEQFPCSRGGEPQGLPFQFPREGGRRPLEESCVQVEASPDQLRLRRPLDLASAAGGRV